MQSIVVARNPQCRACVRHEYSYLLGESQPHITMCGRDSVQIHERRRALDLAALGERLSAAGVAVKKNDFLVKFAVPPYEMTVFGDGRAPPIHPSRARCMRGISAPEHHNQLTCHPEECGSIPKDLN
jgi:hypothetical protein